MVKMFLDIDLNYGNSARSYYPGEVIDVEVLINATLKLYCRSVKVIFKCPYQMKKKTTVEYFRLVKKATFEPTGRTAENFKFKKGLNKFKVKCEIPQLSDNVFKSK